MTPPAEAGTMLVAFDFDGTLSDSEMTVLLGRRVGAAEEMERITERAMNDELDYAESLRQRVALLEGLSVESAEGAFGEVELRPDAADVVAALHDAGHHVAVLTGGFERGVQAALARDGAEIDTLVANRVLDDGDQLTGKVDGPLIEGTKDDALRDLADEVGVPMDETVAVGDGANDLPMLEVAGFAVGYDPKPAVEPACDIVVTSMAELRDLLAERGLL